VKSEHRFVGSAKLIATFTLGSRILGLVREHAYSRFFGASPLFSAFRIAFQIPNLARRLFGEGALTASFIPGVHPNASRGR
jgi:putative peptidoglycan lipid II flippase